MRAYNVKLGSTLFSDKIQWNVKTSFPFVGFISDSRLMLFYSNQGAFDTSIIIFIIIIFNYSNQGAFDTSIVDESAASGCVLSIITYLASPIFNDSKSHQIATNCTKFHTITPNCKRVHINYYRFGISK